MSAAALEHRPLTIAEVANVYSRPISFVHAQVKSGRLHSFGRGIVGARIPWSSVVGGYCGVPNVTLEHPDDTEAERRRRREEEARRLEAARDQDRRSVDRDVVYFVEAASVSLVKIGVADDPRARFRSLVTMNAAPVRLVALMPGRKSQERELHRRFATQRAHGEWFKLSKQLTVVISEMRERYGLPGWAT